MFKPLSGASPFQARRCENVALSLVSKLRMYRFRFLQNGKFLHTTNLHFGSDLDALDHAASFGQDFEVEIHAGERLVANVSNGSAPL